MKELLLLCVEFFKTGLFAVGGGMATIPFLIQMTNTHPEWFTLPMLMDMIAVSESTPGPIGVNMATYTGFTAYGVWGGILSTLSLTLPSYIVIVIVAGALKKYRDNALVDASFKALRAAVTGLIAAAGYNILVIALFPETGVSLIAVLLFALLLVAMHWHKTKKLHPILYIALSAVIGILFKL